MHKLHIVLSFCVLLTLLGATCALAQDAIAPGDRIRVWVKGEPDLTVERVVGKDGSISYPLLGNVGVNNLKPHEAAKVIASLLDDGYIRQPLVQVEVISRSGGALTTSKTPPSSEPPLNQPEARQKTSPRSPKIIQLVDGITGEGIVNAAVLVGGKIYQSNSAGQIIAEDISGRIIVLADGYKILQGPVEQFLKPGNTAKIVMDKVPLVDEVTIKVIDAATKKPLEGVKVKLDGTSVKTNAQGVFKIKDIRKEFAEIRLEISGYKPLRKILDFKTPGERIIAMEHNE